MLVTEHDRVTVVFWNSLSPGFTSDAYTDGALERWKLGRQSGRVRARIS